MNDQQDCHNDIVAQDYDRVLDGYSMHQLIEQIAVLHKEPSIYKALIAVIKEIDPQGLLDDYFNDLK